MSAVQTKNSVENSAIRGLYAIVDTKLVSNTTLISATKQAIVGGAHIIQYRDKHADPLTRNKQAMQLAELCRQHQTVFIINDDVQLAMDCQADGVHLGQNDMSPTDARKKLGPESLIGVSCYNDIKRARAAEKEGADYIALGSFYSSPTKPEAVIATKQLLGQSSNELSIPIVAIGGITTNNAKTLITHGADAIAVISELFNYKNIKQQAELFSNLF